MRAARRESPADKRANPATRAKESSALGNQISSGSSTNGKALSGQNTTETLGGRSGVASASWVENCKTNAGIEKWLDAVIPFAPGVDPSRVATMDEHGSCPHSDSCEQSSCFPQSQGCSRTPAVQSVGAANSAHRPKIRDRAFLMGLIIGWNCNQVKSRWQPIRGLPSLFSGHRNGVCSGLEILSSDRSATWLGARDAASAGDSGSSCDSIGWQGQAGHARRLQRLKHVPASGGGCGP